MAGTFNTYFVTEIILELNHSTEIYVKCHLTNKLLNYNLILGRDLLCELGIIFTFKNKQPLGKKFQFQSNHQKEFFVIKESHSFRNATKRIKQILDAEYKEINLNLTIMNLNYLKDKHKNSL